MRTKAIFAVLCVLAAGVFRVLPLHAQELEIGVLSQDDIQTYRDIFADQEKGRIKQADAGLDRLQDKSLTGYVLLHRYMLKRGYTSKFAELKSWMEQYADHDGADRVYALALKRRPQRSVRVAAPR